MEKQANGLLKGKLCNYASRSFECQLDEGIELLDAALEKLIHYEDLEEQGKLLELPCKVGDTVYILAGRFGNYYEQDICDGFYIDRDCNLQVKVQNNKGNHGTYGKIGETAFLTKGEAEKALKEGAE